MNEKGKISGLYSWPVIILALCIFWPVGIFLIIKRVSVDKKTAMGALHCRNWLYCLFERWFWLR